MTKRYTIVEEEERSPFLAIVIFFVLVYFIFGGSSSTKEPEAKIEQPVPTVSVESGCDAQTSSNLVNQHTVGPIVNLSKNKIDHGSEGECTVEFDITVNGQLHHLTETETGFEQLESLCYYARERARKNLLLDLGGEFKTESVVTCRDTSR